MPMTLRQTKNHDRPVTNESARFCVLSYTTNHPFLFILKNNNSCRYSSPTSAPAPRQERNGCFGGCSGASGSGFQLRQVWFLWRFEGLHAFLQVRRLFRHRGTFHALRIRLRRRHNLRRINLGLQPSVMGQSASCLLIFFFGLIPIFG